MLFVLRYRSNKLNGDKCWRENVKEKVLKLTKVDLNQLIDCNDYAVCRPCLTQLDKTNDFVDQVEHSLSTLLTKSGKSKRCHMTPDKSQRVTDTLANFTGSVSNYSFATPLMSSTPEKSKVFNVMSTNLSLCNHPKIFSGQIIYQC